MHWPSPHLKFWGDRPPSPLRSPPLEEQQLEPVEEQQLELEQSQLQTVQRVLISDISPLPKAFSGQGNGRKRVAQKSVIITSSPFKNILVDKFQSDNIKK